MKPTFRYSFNPLVHLHQTMTACTIYCLQSSCPLMNLKGHLFGNNSLCLEGRINKTWQLFVTIFCNHVLGQVHFTAHVVHSAQLEVFYGM